MPSRDALGWVNTPHLTADSVQPLAYAPLERHPRDRSVIDWGTALGFPWLSAGRWIYR